MTQPVDYGALVAVLVILGSIGAMLWAKDRTIARKQKEKVDADMRRIEEANRLRDSQSLVARANEYWDKHKPPGGEGPK